MPCGGGGTQARSYAISQPAQHGGGACLEVHGARQWQACNEMSCDAVVHCAGGWGAWSGCSALCGGGTRSQAYSVSTEARNGGRDCAAAAGDTRVQPCNTEPCPVNCEGAWGAWGQCDRPCGGGEQSRSYSVTTASAHGGIPCVAEQWQTRSCNTADCGAPSVSATASGLSSVLGILNHAASSAGRQPHVLLLFLPRALLAARCPPRCPPRGGV